MPDWWIDHRKQIVTDRRKGFDSLVVLVCWLLWKGRNTCAFDNLSMQAIDLADWIRQISRQWVVVGFTPLSDYLQ
jgi:hypothetical protein